MPDALRDYAVDNLRYIRDAMERASAFTSIPGWGGFAIGLSALATAAIAEPMTVWNPRRWLSVWLIEAAVAAVIGAVSMWQKARRSGARFMSGAGRRFFVSYFAPLIAGAILTVTIVRSGAVDVLPAVWLLLYGAAFVSSGAFSIRVIPVMGVGFMLFGAVAAFVPLAVANLLLGAAFGVLHIIFGLIIARNYGG
ncbi:MAG: hypothetical protein DMF58_13640 [Acidobacteria bacterium]|nr:MAG: hypothetical protein DMF58_13640 [Acidobacteriota bacterium]